MIKTLIIFLSVLLVSCSECDDIVVCRGITDQAVSKLPFRNNNTVTFINDEDSLIIFQKKKYHMTSSEVKDCYEPFGGECTCPECDSPLASIHFSTEVPIQEEYEAKITQSWVDTLGDSTVRRDTTFYSLRTQFYSNFSVTVRDNKAGDTLSFMVELFNFRNFIKVYLKENNQYDLSLGSDDSLLSSFQTPVKNYKNVIKMHTNYNREMEIEDVFYSMEYGIIAFYSKKLNKYFYRSDL